MFATGKLHLRGHMSREGFRCFECDNKAQHAHHIVPKVLGGKRTLPLCTDCHSKVHDHDFTNHSELTRKGIAKYRATGGHYGRPYSKIDLDRVERLVKKGLRYKDIAKKLGVAASTIFAHIERRRNENT